MFRLLARMLVKRSLRLIDETVVYENSGFIYVTSAWGKIREYEVIEDTEKVAQLDVWLAKNGANRSPASVVQS
jgi:hypothetical protein